MAYTHAEFGNEAVPSFIVGTVDGPGEGSSHHKSNYVSVFLMGTDGDLHRSLLTKQEAAKLAGHLLQASDADDLTAVGDDK